MPPRHQHSKCVGALLVPSKLPWKTAKQPPFLTPIGTFRGRSTVLFDVPNPVLQYQKSIQYP